MSTTLVIGTAFALWTLVIPAAVVALRLRRVVAAERRAKPAGGLEPVMPRGCEGRRRRASIGSLVARPR